MTLAFQNYWWMLMELFFRCRPIGLSASKGLLHNYEILSGSSEVRACEVWRVHTRKSNLSSSTFQSVAKLALLRRSVSLCEIGFFKLSYRKLQKFVRASLAELCWQCPFFALMDFSPDVFPFWSNSRTTLATRCSTFFQIIMKWDLGMREEGSSPFMWHTFGFVWPRFSKDGHRRVHKGKNVRGFSW